MTDSRAARRARRTARYVRDETAWVVHVVGAPSVSASGATLDVAARRIREELAADLGCGAEFVQLLNDVRLENRTKQLVDGYLEAECAMQGVCSN